MGYLRTLFGGLPELVVSEYQRGYSGVELIPDTGTTGSNLDRLQRAELDVAFVMTPVSGRAIRSSFG
jgi:hypothetical protein